jgi:hypothetical protein
MVCIKLVSPFEIQLPDLLPLCLDGLSDKLHVTGSLIHFDDHYSGLNTIFPVSIFCITTCQCSGVSMSDTLLIISHSANITSILNNSLLTYVLFLFSFDDYENISFKPIMEEEQAAAGGQEFHLLELAEEQVEE